MTPYARVLAIIAAGILASGCSSTLKVAKPDASGHFSTQFLLDDGGAKTVKPFGDKYRAMVYLKMDETKTKQYTDFFVTSFSNMGIFSKVAQKSDLEQLVIERKLADKVSNVSDLIGLNNLQKQIGPFLVVEPSVEWKGGYNYVGSMKATDPETGETMLMLEQHAFNWSGLDGPLFYPLLNAFADWAHGQPIAMSKPEPAVVGRKPAKHRDSGAPAAEPPAPAPAPAAAAAPPAATPADPAAAPAPEAPTPATH